MEASESFATIERTVRRAIRHLLPDWQSRIDPNDLKRASAARAQEIRKRAGVQVSSDLLDFVYTKPVFELLARNPKAFEDMFQDTAQLSAFLEYAESVRNTSAHVRELVTFERDMLAGIAGYLANHLARWETRNLDVAADYPIIANVRDSFGQEAIEGFVRVHSGYQVVSVGDQIEIIGQAVEARGKGVRWWFGFGETHELLQGFDPVTITYPEKPSMARGSSVRFKYRVTADDVGTHRQFRVIIASTSRHHKHVQHDDLRILHYRVRPPHDA